MQASDGSGAYELSKGFKSYGAFKKLSTKFLTLNIAKVECVVLSEKDADVWIQRKHDKGIGGKGVVRWNAVGTARSDAAKGKFAAWLAVCNFLSKQGVDISTMMEGIENKTTSVERVLGSNTNLSEILGITIKNDGIISSEINDDTKLTQLLKTLMSEMAKLTFNEPLVTTVDLQKEL